MTGVIVFPLLLLISAVLTQLAASRVLGSNRVAGIRTRSTLRSRDAWVAGHRAAAWWAWGGFAASAAASAGALLLGGVGAVILAVVVVVVFVATIVISLAAANRAARASAILEG
jgi:hypothetical protein